MTSRRVSIVLPTMNRAHRLVRAIDSCLEQTYPHWELIIVDGQSHDDTPQIVARYAAKDPRIRFISHPPEQGRLPGALNVGFALASGDYHTWLQDDNYFKPHALATMAAYLDAHPHVGLVYSAYEAIDEASGTRRLQPVLPPDYLAEKCVVTPSFLYRRALYEQLGGYRIEYYLAEDYDFWLRAYSRWPFAALDPSLHVYYFHSNSLTESARRRDIDDAASRALLWALEHEPWTRRPRQRARIYRYLASMAMRRDDHIAYRRYLWRALLHDPGLIIRGALRRWWRNYRQSQHR